MLILTGGQSFLLEKHTRRSGAWLCLHQTALNQQENNMNEHERNLRDLAAMFAMTGLLARGEIISVPAKALMLANEYMDARESADEEHGIVALKKSRKAKDV